MHPLQRKINNAHVQKLLDQFQYQGVLRIENPGVVIGNGSGWYNMKKLGPKHIFIKPTSPHLNALNLAPDGPIGQIIRGGHRTAVAFEQKENIGQDYWYCNDYFSSH